MSEHLPVMAAEVVEFLVTRPNGGYIDCTVGAGGHARFIMGREKCTPFFTCKP